MALFLVHSHSRTAHRQARKGAPPIMEGRMHIQSPDRQCLQFDEDLCLGLGVGQSGDEWEE